LQGDASHQWLTKVVDKNRIIEKMEGILGRCYANNFLQFLPISGEKMWFFCSKTNDKIKFVQKLSEV
jgi:hypothetical protein